MTQHIGAVVLAAGFSNRFGSIKICAELSSGRSVFQQTLSNIQAAVPDVLVITRDEVYPMIAEEPVELQVFDEAEKGMGATLAFAIRLVMSRGQWNAALICLADMPFISPSTYRSVAEQLAEDRIVVPNYRGRPGNPTGFGSRFFTDLGNLTGDRGGRVVIRNNPAAVIQLSVDDAAVLQDIDTPDDLTRYDGRP